MERAAVQSAYACAQSAPNPCYDDSRMQYRGWELRYQPQLDGVRALAVLAVLASHTSSPYTGGGIIGVDVFFVLSGYLITRLLLQEWVTSGSIRIGGFYMRRMRRLYPVLITVCGVTGVIYAATGLGGTFADSTVREIPAAVTYTMGWLRAFRVGDAAALTHTWSLSAEEHFYIVWPLVLIGLLRTGYRALRYGSLAIWLLSTGYVVAASWLGVDQQRLYFGPDTRFYEVMTGCALAVWLKPSASRRRQEDIALALGVAFTLWMITACSFSWLPYYRGLNVVLVVSIALFVRYLVLWPNGWVSQLMAIRPLVWLGKRSYSLYLWQVPVFAFFDHMFRRLHGWRILPAIIVSIILAAISYLLVERPFLAGATRRHRGEALTHGDRLVVGEGVSE